MTETPETVAAVSAPSRWRARNAVVEARQLADDLRNHTEVAAWIEANGGHAEIPFAEPCLYVETPQGRMRAGIGDWIIKGVTGLFFIKADAEFREGYEPASPLPADVPLRLGRCPEHPGKVHAQAGSAGEWACLRGLADVAEAGVAGQSGDLPEAGNASLRERLRIAGEERDTALTEAAGYSGQLAEVRRITYQGGQDAASVRQELLACLEANGGQHARQPADVRPRDGEPGWLDVTCGGCGEEFGTNVAVAELECPECEARRCPSCQAWFGGSDG